MSNTLTAHTTAKLIGLAACGAAYLGLSLDDALLTRTEDLLAALTAAGLLPGTTAPTTPAVAAEEPADIYQSPRVPLPVPVPPSLRGPGEPIPDPGNIDWDDPETYR